MKQIKNFFKFLGKHKIMTIICSFILVLIILLPITYVSKYNKHQIFGLDDIKFSNPSENRYVNFSLMASEYKEAKYNTSNTITNGNLKIDSKTKALETVTNIEITYLLTTNWDSEWEDNKSETTIHIADKLTPNQKEISKTSNVAIKKIFPFKPILFVEVKNPTLYVKLTFETAKTVATNEATTKHEYYYKYDFNQYTNESTIMS